MTQSSPMLARDPDRPTRTKAQSLKRHTHQSGQIAPYFFTWLLIVIFTYLGAKILGAEHIHHWAIALALGVAALVLGVGLIKAWFAYRLVVKVPTSKIASAEPGFREFDCKVHPSSLRQTAPVFEADTLSRITAGEALGTLENCVWYHHITYQKRTSNFFRSRRNNRKIIHEEKSKHPIWVTDDSGAKLLLHPSFLKQSLLRHRASEDIKVDNGLIINKVIQHSLTYVSIGDQFLINGDLANFAGADVSLARHLAGPKANDSTVNALINPIKELLAHTNTVDSEQTSKFSGSFFANDSRKIKALGFSQSKRSGLMARGSESDHLQISRFILRINVLIVLITAGVAVHSALHPNVLDALLNSHSAFSRFLLK